ncbi:MAG: diphosphomevalonate decarboxylase [marine bacterium B5-7]|nr:MAG: diphosphomevalonate decarboxylase [marine bacterium B5-7]
MKQIIQASAPSNIALIKYMGKIDFEKNLPTNPSLSFTLENLRSYVELELVQEKTLSVSSDPECLSKTVGGRDSRHRAPGMASCVFSTNIVDPSAENAFDTWAPLSHPQCQPLTLSDSAQNRFLTHFSMLKNYFKCEEQFIVRSANNFPASCGLASSAASFAALTRAAIEAMAETPISAKEKTTLARLGSGSACRSLLGPWVVWDLENVYAIDLPYPELLHHVIVVEEQEKTLRSSDAHRLVMSSPHFKGRPERAIARKTQLIESLCEQNWRAAFEIVWDEFQDMHELFHTASTPFRYLSDKSQHVLDHFQDVWKKHDDGPLVTMDAGPNIHVLFRPDQTQLAEKTLAPLREVYHVI